MIALLDCGLFIGLPIENAKYRRPPEKEWQLQAQKFTKKQEGCLGIIECSDLFIINIVA